MNVIEFAVVMQQKIDANSHKSGWEYCTIKWLLNRLVQEKGELKRAIEKKLHPDEIDREAADVANFAMMIADNYRRDWDDKDA
ncbi:hypothetical protein M0Q28_05835 [Patescibacteria group bacterium]|jgi:NTP pyrophosphatase (non-canonical NTP hydrolase)|nr:hypothetical protein [Patescibacteria group bacterium]